MEAERKRGLSGSEEEEEAAKVPRLEASDSSSSGTNLASPGQNFF